MEVNGDLYAPADLPPVPTGQEAGWAPESGSTLWIINYYPCWESESGRPVHSLSLYRLSYPCSVSLIAE
jgi:hypothetical protein